MLPDQLFVMCFTTCLIIPFHIAEILTFWLFALGFKFEHKTRTGLLWNCIRANLLHWLTLLGLFGIFSLMGEYLPPRDDYLPGTISLLCLLTIPPISSLSCEYKGCQKILPNASRERIVTYIIVSTVSAVAIIFLLVLAILLILFLYALLKIITS